MELTYCGIKPFNKNNPPKHSRRPIRHKPKTTPFTQEEYFNLVDETGRLLREDKRGAIDASKTPPVITQLVARLGINPLHWLEHIKHFRRYYAHCVGTPEAICIFAGSDLPPN